MKLECNIYDDKLKKATKKAEKLDGCKCPKKVAST